jgi:hypothetical protein
MCQKQGFDVAYFEMAELQGASVEVRSVLKKVGRRVVHSAATSLYITRNVRLASDFKIR